MCPRVRVRVRVRVSVSVSVCVSVCLCVSARMCVLTCAVLVCAAAAACSRWFTVLAASSHPRMRHHRLRRRRRRSSVALSFLKPPRFISKSSPGRVCVVVKVSMPIFLLLSWEGHEALGCAQAIQVRLQMMIDVHARP